MTAKPPPSGRSDYTPGTGVQPLIHCVEPEIGAAGTMTALRRHTAETATKPNTPGFHQNLEILVVSVHKPMLSEVVLVG